MSNPPKLQKVRTFADDVAAAQAAATSSAPETTVVPPETTTPVAPPAPIKKTTASTASTIPEPPEDTFIDVTIENPDQSKVVADISEVIGGGEVIAEKKDHRFRVLPAISNAFTGWAKDKAHDVVEANQGATVEDPSKRAETVSKAAEQSALPSQDDFTATAATIAAQPKVTAEETLHVTPAEELPTPQWSSSISTESEVSEEAVESATAIIDEVEVEPPSPAPTSREITEPEVVIETKDTPTVKPITQPTPTAETTTKPALTEPEVVLDTPFIPLAEPVANPPSPETTPTTSRWTDSTATVSPESEIIPEPTVPEALAATPPEEGSTEAPVTPAEPRYQFRATPTEAPVRDWRSWLVVGFVVIAAVTAGITISLFVYQYLSAPNGILAPEIPSAVIVDTTEAVPLSRDSQSLLSSLRQMAISGSGVTQAYPTVTTEDGLVRPATAAEILAIVPLEASGSFTRNITNITIIGVGQSDVGLLFSFTNLEIALAGIYGWEQFIVRDLGSLLGSSPHTRFTDTTSNNRDIRIAERGDGSELLYTFIDRNTLLIATSRSVVEEVINRQK